MDEKKTGEGTLTASGLILTSSPPSPPKAALSRVITRGVEEPKKKLSKKPEGELTSRALNISLADRKFEEVEDGLLIRNVKMLAAGTWTDSYQRTPCTYLPKVLEKYATNWKSNGFWLRHAGGQPRAIDEKVGRVLNPRFENDAVIGDVFLHMASTRSRDYAEMAKKGVVEDVSVDVATSDSYDKVTKVYQANYVEFSGLCAVDRGACTVCGLRGHEQEQCPDEVKEMNEEEAKRFEAMTVEIAELKKQVAALPVPVKPEELKAVSDALEAEKKVRDDEKKAHEEQNKAYEERIKRLENAPAPRTLASEDGEKKVERRIGKLPIISNDSIQCE